MMRIYSIFACLLLLGCQQKQVVDVEKEKEIINKTVDNWHKDVADIKFDAYFKAMSDSSVFIGTDAFENWTKPEFMDFARPYFFEKKKTWDFTPLERNVYVSKNGDVAWFDELLDTWMKICRGSGVLEKEDNTWKIKHYVLSATIPNDSMKHVVSIKAKADSIYIENTYKK